MSSSLRLNKTLLSMALAATFSFVSLSSYAATAKYSFTSTSKNIDSEEAVSYIKNGSQSHVSGAQAYLSNKAGNNTEMHLYAPEITLQGIREKPSTGADGLVSGFNMYVSSYHKDDMTLKMLIGNEETKSIDISGSGYGTAMGVFIKGEDTPSDGIATKNGPTVEISGKNVNISAHSIDGYSHGIYVGNNTTELNGKAAASLKINAENLTIDATSDVEGLSSGITAYSQGEVEINGNVTVTADAVITTRGNSTVKINANPDSTGNQVQLNGDIVFDYHETTGVNSTVQINLDGQGSYWTGNTITAWNGELENPDETLKVTGMTLGLSNGATWTPTVTANDDTTSVSGSKYVVLNTLNMDNGTVNITNEDIEVTVENMSGSGEVNLATNGETSGKFNVLAASDSSLNVNLMDEGMTRALTADEITSDQAKKLLQNVGSNSEGESVVSTSTEVAEGLVNNAFGIDANGKTTVASVNTLMQSALELAASTPLTLNRIMMNDVRKRLGDIRTSQGTYGAWVRYDGGELSGHNGFETDFNTVQVGIDSSEILNSFRIGAAFSYTDGDSDYLRGSADMKAYGLALYGTWLGDNGQFLDLIGRIGTADTDLVIDHNIKGDIDNLAVSLSGEFGWRFDLTDMVYVEPQIEATYTYIDSDDFKLSTAKYNLDSVDSFITRAGFAAGFKCPSDYGNVYVRASIVHEFLGDSKISGTNLGQRNFYEINGEDTWAEYGLGANINFSKNVYGWADVERTTGGALDEDWRATVGVRYTW